MAQHKNNILLNDVLYNRVSDVFNNKDKDIIDTEDQMLLENTYKSFVRNGAKLNTEQKEKLRELDAELSKLALKFGEKCIGRQQPISTTYYR